MEADKMSDQFAAEIRDQLKEVAHALAALTRQLEALTAAKKQTPPS
jgi:hypothetical protein